MDKETATPTHKRFQGYYLDYLIRFYSIGSYAAAYGLTYGTAEHRIKLGEQIHNETAARATLKDAMAATGLALDF
jgi:hypothetical protein|tara:strand:+ start:282 stop:506 length:225 start_codon:yes stop_codon:yes gene_type:complete